jgi:invasion protein IalB
MMRKFLFAALAALSVVLLAGEAALARKKQPEPDPESDKPAKSVPAPGGGKALELGKFGDWGAYSTAGAKGKVCYALGQPKNREPKGLNRDPGYLFISTRPGDGVRGEVSFIFGFPLKEGSADSVAEAGDKTFELVAKGENAWLADPQKEPAFIEAIRKTGKLLIKVPSKKGNDTTDTYSLTGLSQALDRVKKECP